jgi:hypothetical protein
LVQQNQRSLNSGVSVGTITTAYRCEAGIGERKLLRVSHGQVELRPLGDRVGQRFHRDVHPDDALRPRPGGDFLCQRAAVATDVQQSSIDLRGQLGHFLEPAPVPVPLDQVVFYRRIVKVRRNVFVDLLQIMLMLVLLVFVMALLSGCPGVDRHGA